MDFKITRCYQNRLGQIQQYPTGHYSAMDMGKPVNFQCSIVQALEAWKKTKENNDREEDGHGDEKISSFSWLAFCRF